MEEYCGCPILWEGERCHIPWKTDPIWMVCVTFYQVINTILFGSLFFWSLFEIVKIFFHSDFQKARSIAMYGLTLASFGSLLRCIAFGVDPHSIRGITSVTWFKFLTSTSIFLWISAGFGVCLYWMEVCRYLDTHRETPFASKLVPVLYTLMLSVWLTLFLNSFFQATASNVTADAILYITVMSWFFTFLTISVVYGLTLRSRLKPLRTIEAATMRSRIAVYLLMIGAAFVIEVVDHILLVNYRWMYYKETFLTVHSFNRVAEALAVLSWVLLFRKSYDTTPSRRNDGQSTTRDSMSMRSGSRHSASSREVLGDSYSNSHSILGDNPGDEKED
ncbi:hypothetical protein PROFUN_08644 [Planoprotostelium fungivorum]|uniref:Transmembrane protein n=1 Tax=Planoprotostelium fungivorum TaxID=1890364 RepID=A0A2P6NJ27_9EUKA|nr:hypothetical protein PROFUN_08644 [Planoprotostelium fungivorum]